MPAPVVGADVTAVRDAVEAALPIVRAHAADTEQGRRIPDRVVEALRGTGLNRMLLPPELGGLDAPAVDIVDVIERIAAVDGSTAWCAVIGTGSNLFAGYLPPAGARRVFADPDQGSATMLAPAGTLTAHDGGYRLSGRWPFTSNCLHSAWIGLAAFRADDPGPRKVVRVAFVPAADVEVEDTWHSGGLRGTGSHHVAVRDLAVDPDRCCVFGGDRWAGGQLWRIPILCTFLPLLAAVPLGVARGALDEIARQVREGRAAQRGPLAEDPVGLAELATADARLRAADAGLRAVLGEVHDAAEQHRPVLPALQARVCLVAQEATDAAVEATAAAHRLGGGAAAYRDSPLLRALEDVHAARQHQLFAHKHRGELARALAGLDVRYPPFVVDPV